MKTKQPLSQLLFYGITIILFLIDLGSISIFERPIIYSLLCFYLLQLARPISWWRITFVCLLFSLSSLLHYDRFGLALVYLIPATLLGIKMRKVLYDSYWQYYLLLAACLLAQIIVVEHLILHLSISIPYTISTLFVNLVIIGLLSYLLAYFKPRA